MSYILGIGFAVIGFCIVFAMLYKKSVIDKKIQELRDTEDEKLKAKIKAKEIIKNAESEALILKKDIELKAKETVYQMKEEAEKEIKIAKNEVLQKELRLTRKEESVDNKLEKIEAKSIELEKTRGELEKKNEEVQALIEKQEVELERISELSKSEAKEMLISKLRDSLTHETAVAIREFEAKLKETKEDISKRILSTVIGKAASEYVVDSTVSVVNLPNDEMKGRIIGREGRNIRTLETLTGIDLIIDDTPEAVILSGFDPIRREIARIALEKLIADGRIHPARIEEMVEKARKEVENIIKEYGEQAAFETGVHGLHPELIKLLGRLNYRTSYGQNVLKHSIEVAHIAGIMASELGVDVKLAKRAGLLHDIGKSVDHEMEGTHVEIGMDLLRRYKESKEVIHAMSTHHGDYEPQTIEAVLVTAADAISAARPGARRETLEAYIKRLEKLEEIANSYEGVEKSFAIQAGREIRIMVKPEEVSDEEIHLLARDMTKKIEEGLEYPGQIKVSIIRETRAIEYAK